MSRDAVALHLKKTLTLPKEIEPALAVEALELTCCGALLAKAGAG